jgi:hypothetical protein
MALKDGPEQHAGGDVHGGWSFYWHFSEKKRNEMKYFFADNCHSTFRKIDRAKMGTYSGSLTWHRPPLHRSIMSRTTSIPYSSLFWTAGSFLIYFFLYRRSDDGP